MVSSQMPVVMDTAIQSAVSSGLCGCIPSSDAQPVRPRMRILTGEITRAEAARSRTAVKSSGNELGRLEGLGRHRRRTLGWNCEDRRRREPNQKPGPSMEHGRFWEWWIPLFDWEADLWLLVTPIPRRADSVQLYLRATPAQAILKNVGGRFAAWQNLST